MDINVNYNTFIETIDESDLPFLPNEIRSIIHSYVFNQKPVILSATDIFFKREALSSLGMGLGACYGFYLNTSLRDSGSSMIYRSTVLPFCGFVVGRLFDIALNIKLPENEFESPSMVTFYGLVFAISFPLIRPFLK